jgi:hypothetical protein
MIRLGWSTRDVTPNRPALLRGQKHRRIGRSALDPVSVTAWALEAGNPAHATVLVSCDLVSPSEGLVRRVREAAGQRLAGILPDRVVLFATHTHTSLELSEGWYEEAGGDVMTGAECEEWVAERAIAAVVEAWEGRRPRMLTRAFGHAVVGHNRYAAYADGHFQMYGKTNREDFRGFGGYEDHSVDMLLALGEDGRPQGIALAIPCPSQVTEQLEQFSADYWHEVRVELRRRYGEGLSLLPMCGAAGDQSPHFLLYGKQEEEMRARRGLGERQEIARRVGEAVALAVEGAGAAPSLDGPLAHEVRRVELAPRTVSKADRDWAVASLEASRKLGTRGGGWFERGLQRVLDVHDGKRSPEPVPAELHAVRLGDFALVTNPFELFLDYALRIKARSPAGQTAVVQLAGAGMYLPSERAVEGGGYGVNPVVSNVGPEGGRQLVEETLGMLGRLFPSAG